MMISRFKNMYYLLTCVGFFTTNNFVNAQEKASNKEIFWNLQHDNSIRWNLADEARLPHKDDIEMAGQRVAGIIHYEVDNKKQLHVIREIIFPQLRKFIKNTDPEGMNYRAYLKGDYKDELLPVIIYQNKVLDQGPLDSISISGKLTFYQSGSGGLKIKRCFFPSMTQRLFVEKWTITNTTDSLKKLSIGHTTLKQQETGVLGNYQRQVYCDAANEAAIQPGGMYEFAIYFAAALNGEQTEKMNFETAASERNIFLDSIQNSLVLQTPDAVLNRLFYFSKIRAAESIYQSSMGLVHSPGGGRYYTGVWANDQAEYSGPFFPYLGYITGDIAAMNAYRKFLKNIPTDGGKIWASFEMDGQFPCCSQDRGDAAMILFGATHFLLASGNKGYANELWPLLEWCVAYSEKMKNREGVIASQSDELEGRFPTGTANLSTSSLYYGGLLQLSALAKAMGKPTALVTDYRQKAAQLSIAIDKYFGGEVEDLNTYKYYKENTTLRSWICLPLVMGLDARKEGTLDALFNKLWTNNGVLIESIKDTTKPPVFWDRGTLYAFRGAFKAGAADRALEKLTAFSNTRLLGFHVPYVVEAWPEGSMAHLSAESALYCRIFTEGLLGLTPTGFNSFTLQPHLPSKWQYIELNHMKAFNGDINIDIKREGADLQITVSNAGKTILSKKIKDGHLVKVSL